MPAKRRRGVPAILPREPLTRKAEAAIFKYVALRSEGRPLVMLLGVKLTLRAERMRREDLYAWLEKKGYRWRPRVGWQVIVSLSD